MIWKLKRLRLDMTCIHANTKKQRQVVLVYAGVEKIMLNSNHEQITSASIATL